MVNSSIAIQKATEDDLEQIVNSIVLAFSADPVVRWMYPSPQQYLESFPNFVRAFGVKHSLPTLPTIPTVIQVLLFGCLLRVSLTMIR
ncbi:MAG: hypothetical protein QNJ53_22750 [Pleurocapsa sp. MO_192.B19]|nr:hypothetical protein [Pleurocapsa sp. MO_192.B19]